MHGTRSKALNLHTPSAKIEPDFRAGIRPYLAQTVVQFNAEALDAL
jgi:hypothetical protein